MLYTSEASKNENESSSYIAAIKEYRRMLKPGGVLYLSFPFGMHEIEDGFRYSMQRC